MLLLPDQRNMVTSALDGWDFGTELFEKKSSQKLTSKSKFLWKSVRRLLHDYKEWKLGEMIRQKELIF